MKKRILGFIRQLVGQNIVLDKLQDYKKDVLYENRKNQMIEHILHDSESGISEVRYTDHDIIVSLTTYGKRLHDVAFAIESIMQQSLKANRIILWLDETLQNRKLPEALVKQQERGLEIAFCKDIGPYKKLIPALRHIPEAAVITIDDDAIYDFDLLERLVFQHLSNPADICCFRFHRMTFSENGSLLPYMQWERQCADIRPSHLNFATGVGGVLYPPHSLDEEVLNEDVFLNICRTADDVWLKAMAIRKGTRIRPVFARNPDGDEFILNESVQDIGLLNQNMKGEMLNDRQIKAVFTKYDIMSILDQERDSS